MEKPSTKKPMNILKTMVFLNNFMTYFISKASDPIYREPPKPANKAYKINNEWYIEINTLEDLKNLIEEQGEIILNKDTIMIYDDYIE